MKVLFVVAVFACSLLPSFALEKEALLDIAKKPHSRENLIPEMKIFPETREVEVRIEFWSKEDGTVNPEPSKAAVKIVDGMFMVAITEIPQIKSRIVIVSTFDQEAKFYRKWILPPLDAPVIEFIGITLKGSRNISWVNTDPSDGLILSHEEESDTSSKWSALTIVDGEVIRSEKGVATLTK